MIIEFGNHLTLQPGLDDRPKITTLHVPEADALGLGGYTHARGLEVDELKGHLLESVSQRNGITSLPEHEIIVSALHPLEGAWRSHGQGKPAWVHVTPHDLTPDGVPDDLERVLTEYWGVPSGRDYFGTGDIDEFHVKKELQYWTKTPPGSLPGGPSLPDATATYVNSGRVISNVNDGGGQVGATGQATASSSNTLTTATTASSLNCFAGLRVYVTVSATVMVWGNVVSNTNGANTVLTVDRWYAAATPGGSAGTTPSATGTYMIADGGYVSTWFVGLATGANAPTAADTTLSTNGNAEITTGGGGLVRKIAPYAQTSGVATRAITLTPVFTANGSDSLPATVTTIGVFCSMVVGTAATMKFETALGTSAVFSASGDQLTVTETVNGS